MTQKNKPEGAEKAPEASPPAALVVEDNTEAAAAPEANVAVEEVDLGNGVVQENYL